MTQSLFWRVMLFGITFTTTGSALYMTTMNSLVSKQAGDSERGLVLGTFNTASWLGRALGPGMIALLGRGGTGPGCAPVCGGARLCCPVSRSCAGCAPGPPASRPGSRPLTGQRSGTLGGRRRSAYSSAQLKHR